MIYGIAYKLLNNHQDAEDITQDAFLIIFKKLKNFKKKIILYIENKLDKKEKGEIEEHMVECEKCRQYFEFLSELLNENTEKIDENLNHFKSLPFHKKKKIVKNYNKFLELTEDEKILFLQNYIEFLKYDKNKREKFRNVYNELYSNNM